MSKPHPDVAIIFRGTSTPEGTPGVFFLNNVFFCRSLELPWAENKQDISCIPRGKYSATFDPSPDAKLPYRLDVVPGRTGIGFHWGNHAGAVCLGYKSNVEGCILLGDAFGFLDGQEGLVGTRHAVGLLVDRLAGRPFTLFIHRAPYPRF